jgi:hypothetical protein
VRSASGSTASDIAGEAIDDGLELIDTPPLIGEVAPNTVC